MRELTLVSLSLLDITYYLLKVQEENTKLAGPHQNEISKWNEKYSAYTTM